MKTSLWLTGLWITLYSGSILTAQITASLNPPLGDTTPRQTAVEQAQKLAAQGFYQEAIDIYTQLLKTYPGDPDLLLSRGRTYAWNQQYTEAIADLRQVTETFPQYGDAWIALGDVYLWAREPEKAVAAYEQGILLLPDDPLVWLSHAKAGIEANELMQAQADLQKARALGGDQDLIETLQQTIDRRFASQVQRRIDTLLAKTDSLVAIAFYDSAQTVCQQILQLDSTNYDARLRYAQICARLGDLNAAAWNFTRLLRDVPEDVDIHLERGMVYLWMGQYVKAQGDFEFVITRVPEYEEAWLAYGKLYRWQGDYPQAIKVYNRWLKVFPSNPQAYLQRAETYRLGRQFNMARADLLLAKKLGADEKTVKKALHLLDRITLNTTWETRSDYDYQSYGGQRPNWYQFSQALKRELKRGSLIVAFIHANRYNASDQALYGEVYYDLWPRAYANLRVQYALQADVFPPQDVNVEVFQGFGHGWETSAGYRLMNFTQNRVHLGFLSLATYYEAWFILEKMTLFQSSTSQGYSLTFSGRRYLATVDDFIETRLGFGRSVVLLGAGPYIDVRNSKFAVVMIQKFFRPTWGVSANISLNREEGLPPRNGLTMGLIYRW